MPGLSITVVPAYGRDYKSAKDAKADWDIGLDFQVASSGQYCSKRDNIPEVWIRYNNLTMKVKA